jgi:hypothetical protein
LNFSVRGGFLDTTDWSNEKPITRVPNRVAGKELWYSTGGSAWISRKTTRTTIEQSPARAEIECWRRLIASFERDCDWIACWKIGACADLQTYDQWWASLWRSIETGVHTAPYCIIRRITWSKICVEGVDIIITCVWWSFWWPIVGVDA